MQNPSIAHNASAKCTQKRSGWLVCYILADVVCRAIFLFFKFGFQVDLVRVFSQLFSRSTKVDCPVVFFQSPTIVHALLNHSSSPPEYALQTMGIVIFTHNLSSQIFYFWRRLISSPMVFTPRLLPKF
jgi:hypothetical protein